MLTKEGWAFHALAKEWGAVFTDDKHFAEEVGDLYGQRNFDILQLLDHEAIKKNESLQ